MEGRSGDGRGREEGRRGYVGVGEGREGESSGGKGKAGEGREEEGKNDLTHPLSQIAGYATVCHSNILRSKIVKTPTVWRDSFRQASEKHGVCWRAVKIRPIRQAEL